MSSSEHSRRRLEAQARELLARTLENYTGEADGKLKICTVHRAKGLDF